MTYLILKSQINDSKPSYLYHMIIGSGLHIYNLYEFAYTIQIDFPMSKLKCLIYFSFLSENFGSFVVFSANFLYPLIIWPHFHVTGENKRSRELLLHFWTLSDVCLNVSYSRRQHLMEIRYMSLPFHLGFEETMQIISCLIDNSVACSQCSHAFMRVDQVKFSWFICNKAANSDWKP